MKSYIQFTKDTIEAEIVGPLCRDIDKDLRLHQHSVHLDHMTSPNPTDASTTLQGRGRFLELKPLKVLSGVVDLRLLCAQYLDRTFYNLTTVSLNDWKTYGEVCARYQSTVTASVNVSRGATSF